MEIKSTDITTVSGMRGSGKSSWVKYAINHFGKNFLIYDINDEYQEYPRNRYVPKTDDIEEFDRLCKLVWDTGNIMLVVEEAHQYLKNKANLPRNAMLVIRRGRHRNIGVVAVTTRIANLNTEVVSQSHNVVLFRHFSPADIHYLKQFIGNYADRLQDYTDHRYMVYSKGTIKEYPPLKPHQILPPRISY